LILVFKDGGSSGFDLSFTMRTSSTMIQLKYQNGDPKNNICQSSIDPGVFKDGGSSGCVHAL
jgi:hypothetical protein